MKQFELDEKVSMDVIAQVMAAMMSGAQQKYLTSKE